MRNLTRVRWLTEKGDDVHVDVRTGGFPSASRVAAIVSGLVAATAWGGGVELVTGRPRRQPIEWLEGTPFDSYVVPGLLLGGLLGGGNTWACYEAARRTHRWPVAAIVAGSLTTGWICTEVKVLNQPDAPTPIEWAYGGLGIALAGLGVAATLRRGRA